MEQFTKEYFVDKFSNIPKERWGEIYVDKVKKCALGHCGVIIKDGSYIFTEESLALIRLFGGKNYQDWGKVTDVNDFGCYGSDPKERILKKLNSL